MCGMDVWHGWGDHCLLMRWGVLSSQHPSNNPATTPFSQVDLFITHTQLRFAPNDRTAQLACCPDLLSPLAFDIIAIKLECLQMDGN